MPFDPSRHHRRSIRLRGYDYAQAGAYFVTIVTQGGVCRFGEICAGEMRLNEAGQMVSRAWEMLPERFPDITADIYAVMPNHFHGILFLHPHSPAVRTALVAVPLAGADGKSSTPDDDTTQGADTSHRADTRSAPTLGQIIGAFKSITTVEYIRGVRQCGWPPFDGKLWQRNYYEHIIRSSADYERIAAYILANPARWASDSKNPLPNR